MRRWRPWLIGGGFALAAIVLSLSDRAPVFLQRLRSPLRALGRRVEAAFGIDFDIDQSTIPWSTDELVHLVLWGGGMVLLGVALRHRRSADRVAVGLFGASVALEVLQAFVTASRSLSLSDAAANGLGIMLGLTVVVVVDLVRPTRRQRPRVEAAA